MDEAPQSTSNSKLKPKDLDEETKETREIKTERRKHKKKAKLTKPQSPEQYHHTPTFAAQSFTLTATPDVFRRNQTRKRSHPMLDLAKSRRVPSPNIIQPFDERSSGEYDRYSTKTPTNDSRNSPKLPTNRFMPASPQYELFSSTILCQQTPVVPGRRAPEVKDSTTRGRPDWSEMDEKVSQKQLRRTNSVVSSSTKSSKPRQRPKSQGVDLATVLKGNTMLRTPKDDESVYQARGCAPWRIRV
ncbi:hypothetical protein AA313_de0209231 [Arthrobotrys entomopaga]|nr:hypothetical protein AA313_de0209231 [Arthrobotrys entomopaga]